MTKLGYSEDDIDALPGKVATGEYNLQNVLADATKAIEME